MALPQAYHGINLNWGLGLTTVVITGATGLYQSVDTELSTELQVARDQRGNVQGNVWFNPNDTATVEYVVTDAGSPPSGSAAYTYPTQGGMISVTAGTASDPFTGSNWQVESVTFKESNTDAAKISLKLHRWPGVTV